MAIAFKTLKGTGFTVCRKTRFLEGYGLHSLPKNSIL